MFNLKFFLAGDFRFSIYQENMATSLEKFGITVYRFKIKDFLGDDLLSKIEIYTGLLGLKSIIMNFTFIFSILKFRPDIVFIWRGTHVHPITLKFLKFILPKIILVSYNNDDPFSPLYKTQLSFFSRNLWKNFIKCIPIYDLNFVYRKHNFYEYEANKSKKTKLLLPGYIPTISSFELKIKQIDVLFVGHYEKSRYESIKYLIENGINIKVFGTGWEKTNLEKYLDYKIIRLNQKEYFEIIQNSKIILCFLSKLNRDTYTRRNFEIPSLGAFMLSERTNELVGLFKEGKEAEFFNSNIELLEKTKYYLDNDLARDAISKNGYLKCQTSGYDINSIYKKMIQDILKIKKN